MIHPLATLCDQFLKERTFLKNVSPKTILWYQIAFKNYRTQFGDDALPTKASLQQFVIALRERNIRPVTCNTYIGAMNAFCFWLHQEGHATERIKLSKLRVETRVLTLLDEFQLRRILSFKPKTFTQWRVYLAVCLILDTGLRISEALHLRHDDIDLNNLLLRVLGKGRKERVVPFSSELRKRLFRYEQLKAKKHLRNDLVFVGFGGSRWEQRNSTTSLHLLQRKLCLPQFGWHRLRHTFATNYLRQGGDIVRLANRHCGLRTSSCCPTSSLAGRKFRRSASRSASCHSLPQRLAGAPSYSSILSRSSATI